MSDRKGENGGNYQRALTLLNVGIPTSPATAADASDPQPQPSQQWAMPLNFCTPEVEEQRNSSGVREKNGGIL